jgi:hypothetical protein
MTESNSFIETGVLVGYCVLLDPHHTKCKKYVDGDGRELYTSEGVQEEYETTRETVSSRLSSAVLDHVRDLKSDVSQGYLGPMDVDNVKKNVLHRGNDAYQFLYRYYDDVVNNGVQKQELESNLREIARDIDRLVASREDELEEMIEEWEQQDEHPSVEEALEMIHEPDRTWAVEAHDLAVHNGGTTEFATTNPTDFIYNGRKDTVLENTDLNDVVDLSV